MTLADEKKKWLEEKETLSKEKKELETLREIDYLGEDLPKPYYDALAESNGQPAYNKEGKPIEGTVIYSDFEQFTQADKLFNDRISKRC